VGTWGGDFSLVESAEVGVGEFHEDVEAFVVSGEGGCGDFVELSECQRLVGTDTDVGFPLLAGGAVVCIACATCLG